MFIKVSEEQIQKLATQGVFEKHREQHDQEAFTCLIVNSKTKKENTFFIKQELFRIFFG